MSEPIITAPALVALQVLARYQLIVMPGDGSTPPIVGTICRPRGDGSHDYPHVLITAGLKAIELGDGEDNARIVADQEGMHVGDLAEQVDAHEREHHAG